MYDVSVTITSIICVTLIILSAIDALKQAHKDNKEDNKNE